MDREAIIDDILGSIYSEKKWKQEELDSDVMLEINRHKAESLLDEKMSSSELLGCIDLEIQEYFDAGRMEIEDYSTIAILLSLLQRQLQEEVRANNGMGTT